MIELKNVTKAFDARSAVSDLSFKIQEGEIIGLIGQNGAGKSTTFHMILGFTDPDKGQVLWNGESKFSQSHLSVGYMPEERGLYLKESIQSQLLYFAALKGKKREETLNELHYWMKKLNVVGKLTDKVESLSKGNAQKVQLIACLMFNPQLIILDEPFSGLDPVNAELLIDAILEAKNKGAMIVFSSHNMANVERLSDYIVMIHHGKTLLKGTPMDLLAGFGRLKLDLEGWNNYDFLKNRQGVTNIERTSTGGVSADLVSEEEGKIVFDAVRRIGYLPVFNQHYPSLEEIFKLEVEKNGL